MINKVIQSKVNLDGSYKSAVLGSVTALSEFTTTIQLISPINMGVAVMVNFLVYDSRNENVSLFLEPTNKKGADVTSDVDVANWNVWEVDIDAVALSKISKYRAGRIGISFSIYERTTSNIATNYIGLFDSYDTIPTAVYTQGDYFVCNAYNVLFNGMLFNYQDNAVYHNGKWIKDRNVKLILTTATQDLAVDPSLLANVPDVVEQDILDIIANWGQAFVDTLDLKPRVEDLELETARLDNDIEYLQEKISELDTTIFTVKNNSKWVKEIYIDELGKQLDVSRIWNVTGLDNISSPYFVSFANSDETSIVAYVMRNNDSNVLPIVSASNYTTLGYIVINWDLYPNLDEDPKTQLKEASYNVECSPTINGHIEFIENKINVVNELINGNDTVTSLYLDDLPNEVSNNDFIWFPIYKWVRKINKISYLAKSGTISFYKLTLGDTNTYTLITSVINDDNENGKIKEVYVDVELGKNDYVGVNGDFYFDNIERNYKSSNFNISSGAITSPSEQTLFFNCEYDDNVLNKINNLNKFSNNKGRVELYNEKLTSTNADIEGTQTFDAYGLIVNPTVSRLYLNKYYSIEERTVNYVVKFSSDCTAKFESITAPTSVNSTFVIDIQTKNTGLVEGGLPTVRCPILNDIDEFVVSITKNYMDYVVEIRNLNNGSYWTNTYTRNGNGGAGDGAVGTLVNVPMQWDFYGFEATQGSMSISQIVVTAPKCDVIMYGDSITEPEAYYPLNQFDKSWTQLLRKYAGRTKIVTSGRSGTIINQINDRIVNELPFIKPKYCVITIGTNGDWNVAEMQSLVQYIKGLGVIPILNHIPCYDNNGDTTGFLTVNARVDSVRTLENIKGCDLDKATSINNDGITLDETTMWLETYIDNSYYLHHPNVKGSQRIFARFLIDVPEIFNGEQDELLLLVKELQEDKANIQQESWITPTLLNGFEQFNPAYDDVQYMKDTLGFVHIKGLTIAYSATGNVAVFNLPSAYRPNKSMIFTAMNNGDPIRVDVESSGNVTLIGYAGGYASLQISFKGV